jgi:hypothetical protein
MKKENIFIQHAENIGEKELILNNKRIKCDGFCNATNTIYEFHGNFFHGHPLLYNSTQEKLLLSKIKYYKKSYIFYYGITQL